METSSLQTFYGFKNGHNLSNSSKWTANYSLFPPDNTTKTQQDQILDNGKLFKYLIKQIKCHT